MRDYPYQYFFNFVTRLLVEEVFIAAVFPRRKRWGLHLAGSLAILYAIGNLLVRGLQQIPPQIPGVTILYYFLVVMMTGVVLYTVLAVPKKTILFIVTMAYAAEHLCYALNDALLCLMQLYAGSIYVAYADSGVSRGIGWSMVVLVGLILFLIMRRLYQRGIVLKDVDLRMVAVLAAVLVGSDVFSELLPLSVSSIESMQIKMVARLYAALVCVLGIGMEIEINYVNRAERNRQLQDQALAMERDQHRVTQESIDLINMKCHDLRYQLRQLENMDNTQRRKESMQQLQDAINIYDNSIHTGCDPVDLVLTQKSLLCEKYGIKFSVMLDGKALKFMDESDLYALFGNALDNAIESVIKAPGEKRVITLQGHPAGNFVMIHMDNYCEEPVVFNDGVPASSSKGDSSNHGFGTRSIRYLAEQYGGTARMSWQNHIFNLDIMIPAA